MKALCLTAQPLTSLLTITGALSLMLSVSGCGDKAPDAPSQTSAQQAPPAPPPFTLKRSPEELKLSDEVLSFGGSNLLNEDIARVQTLSQRMLSRPLDLREMWLKTFVQTSFLINAEHVDEARPLRVMQLTHNGEPHSVRLIGIKDLSALREALGEYFEELKEGARTLYALKSYRNDTEPLYYAPLPYGMFATTRVKELLSPEKLAMYAQLSEVKFKGLGALHLYPKRLLNGWGEGALTKAEEQVEELSLRGPLASQERQRALLSTGVQLLRQLARDSERVVFTLSLSEDRLRVLTSWRATPQSELSKRFATLTAGPHDLLGHLTSPTPFALSINLPPSQLAVLTALLNESSFTRSLLRDKEGLLERYVTSAVNAASHLKGQVLFAALAPTPASPQQNNQAQKTSPQREGEEAQPADQAVLDALKQPLTSGHLRWMSLMSHTSEVGTRSALDALWGVYQEPKLTRALKRANVYAKVSADTSERGAIEGLPSTHLKARMPRVSRALAPLKPQLKELYDAHVAVGPELVGVGFGDSWAQSLSLLKAEAPTQAQAPQGVQKALKTGAPQPFMFAYLNPIATLAHLKQGRAGTMLLPLQMMAQGLSVEEGLSVSAGAREGEAQLVLNLPFSLITALSRGFAGMGLGAAPTSPVNPSPSALP